MENAVLYFGIASRGTISQWLKAFRKNGINGLHPKPDRDSTLKARIRDIKQAEPNYGYR